MWMKTVPSASPKWDLQRSVCAECNHACECWGSSLLTISFYLKSNYRLYDTMCADIITFWSLLWRLLFPLWGMLGNRLHARGEYYANVTPHWPNNTDFAPFLQFDFAYSTSMTPILYFGKTPLCNTVLKAALLRCIYTAASCFSFIFNGARRIACVVHCG